MPLAACEQTRSFVHKTEVHRNKEDPTYYQIPSYPCLHQQEVLTIVGLSLADRETPSDGKKLDQSACCLLLRLYTLLVNALKEDSL